MMKQQRERCDHCKKFVIIGEGTDLTILCTLADEPLIDHPRKDEPSICGRCFNERPVEANVQYWTGWLNKHYPTKVEPKSAILQEVGWLAPDGKYYPCDYDEPDRLSFWHLRKAREIIQWFYPDAGVSESDYAPDRNGPQEFLVDQGWIRLDVNHLWFHSRPTQPQIDTLFQLWSKPYQRYLPTEELRRFLAWCGVNGMAQPSDEYFEFEASVPDGDLPPLKVPKSFRS